MRTGGAGRTGRRELWSVAPHRVPAEAPRGLQVPRGHATDWVETPESDGATTCWHRPTGEGPHPRVTTNSAAHNPWKKVNKHLFDTVIFNTYS